MTAHEVTITAWCSGGYVLDCLCGFACDTPQRYDVAVKDAKAHVAYVGRLETTGTLDMFVLKAEESR